MKHKFEGIGEACAAVIIAALKANPGTRALAVGVAGKIIFFISKLFCMFLASLGLIILNVGAAKLKTIMDGNDFEDAFSDAEKLIQKIRATGRELTPEEERQIDAPVIDAFRKFASFARVRERGNPRL